MTKKLLLATFAASLALIAPAQTTGTSSPYSRYGVGMLADRSLGFNKGMAGTGIAFANGRQLNLQNPASYARIDSLSFLLDVGMTIQNANFSTATAKQNHGTAQFDYLATGFRLAPNLGLSFGLVPYSSVGYELSALGAPLTSGATTITPTLSYKGTGGLQELYGGLGYAPFKPLSIGANVSYLWGTMTHVASTLYDDAGVQPLRRTYDTEVRSYKVDLGAQYTQRLSRKHSLTLGFTYGFGHELYGTSRFYNQRLTGTTVTAADTLTVRNAFGIPATLGVGLSWQWDNRLRIGVDYVRQQWADVKAPVVTSEGGVLTYRAAKGQYTDRSRVSLGAEYVDHPEGRSWSGRVRYRLGLSYTTPYARIDGTEGPRTYTAGLGVGLPIITGHHNRNMLNLSAEYVHVKPRFAGQITENYLRLSIGLTFNDRWFQKWKVK